jgi:glycerol uptake facilitator protein
MQSVLAEAVGTALLVLLGNGVVANVVLNRTKGQNAGWMVITVSQRQTPNSESEPIGPAG